MPRIMDVGEREDHVLSARVRQLAEALDDRRRRLTP
jgi:hypothetical protein